MLPVAFRGMRGSKTNVERLDGASVLVLAGPAGESLGEQSALPGADQDIEQLVSQDLRDHRAHVGRQAQNYRGHQLCIHLDTGANWPLWCAVAKVFRATELQLLLTHSSCDGNPMQATAQLRAAAIAWIDEHASRGNPT